MPTSQLVKSADAGTLTHLLEDVPRVQVRLVPEAIPSPDRPLVPAQTPAEIGALLQNYFADRVTEEFLVVTLNASNYVINIAVLSRGGLSVAIVEPRSVFQAAILANAAAIVLAHNHPSGSLDPSQADVEITKRLVQAGEVLGIPVHDHVIFGRGDFTSLVEHGLMSVDTNAGEGESHA